MGYMTKYGTYWGQVPHTTGRVFWVAPSATYTVDGRSYSASDDNDGLSPERALRRVNRAWSLVAADAGDVIALLPGTHSAANTSGTATSIAANVAGVRMVGMGRGHVAHGNPFVKSVKLTIAANDETVNVTAANIEIAGITFLGDALNTGAALLNYSAAATGLYIHDCTIDVTAQTASTSILGFDATGAAQYVAFENVVSFCDGAFGAMLDMTATLDSLIVDYKHIQTTGTLAACITTGAATDRCHIVRPYIVDGAGTVTAGIDGTGATVANGVVVSDGRFGVGVTVPIDNFDAGECMISQNYDFGIGATDGGVLIVAIT
jgi:hypothetical protein